MNESIEQLADQLARALAQKKDAILGELITERLGHSSWNLFAIAHRIKRLRYLPERAHEEEREIWLLDDEVLAEFMPLVLKDRQDGHVQMMDATLRHRKFPPGTKITDLFKEKSA